MLLSECHFYPQLTKREISEVQVYNETYYAY